MLQHFRIGFQGHLDAVLHSDYRIRITHEGNHQVLCALRNLVQDKVSVQVCEGSEVGDAFHRHIGSDHRLSVICGDHVTANRPCLREGRLPSKQEGTGTEQTSEQFVSH